LDSFTLTSNGGVIEGQIDDNLELLDKFI
jgi:hypothetical protein